MWKPGIDYSVGTTADKTALLESRAETSFRTTAEIAALGDS